MDQRSVNPDGIDYKILTITPTMAEQIIRSSKPESRSKAHQRKVDGIVNKMLNGEFRFTGLPVTISNENDVLAGSEYLEASIKSGKSFESVIVRGVEPKCRRTIEMGSTRRLMDHLTSMSKLTETDNRVARKDVSSSIPLISRIEGGEYNKWANAPSNEIYKVYFANPGISVAIDSIDFYKNKIKSIENDAPGIGLGMFGSKQVYIACRFLFGLVDESLAQSFFDCLCLVPLNDLERNHPIRTLRVRLAKNDENSTTVNYSPGKQKVIREYKVPNELGWFFSAWNAFRGGRKLAKMSDEIPAISGWRDDIVIYREWNVPPFDAVMGEHEILYPSPTVTLEFITPEDAEEMLKWNKFNRNPKPTVIKKYADEMKNNLWHLNGETIKISSKGFTLDAQHRLYACIEARVGFYSLVVRGIEQEVFAEYDTVRLKGLGDILAAENRSYPQITAGTLRMLIQYLNNTPDGFHAPTNHALAILYDEREDITDSINWVISEISTFDKLISKQRMAFLHYILKDINNDAAEELLKSIASNHPIGEFRDYWNAVNLFIRVIGCYKDMSDNHKHLNLSAAVIDAWNAVVCKSKRFGVNTLTRNMFRPSGSGKNKNKRSFPYPMALKGGKRVIQIPNQFSLASKSS